VERYRIGSDLHLQQLGATDSVTILNWFDDPSLQIERVLFADGAIWDAAMTGSLLRLGTADDDLVVGNQYDETLEGRTGNDTLDGGNGNDTMIGGAGDDTYIVENVDDIVVENADEGGDSVQSSVTYTLSADVENLTLTGNSTINGTGNAGDNLLIGNAAANTLTGDAGNDTLDGGAGVDVLRGGVGDDTYVLNNAGDIVTETRW
jgi:Ca2+-binding RTX toxin-like protein